MIILFLTLIYHLHLHRSLLSPMPRGIGEDEIFDEGTTITTRPPIYTKPLSDEGITCMKPSPITRTIPHFIKVE